MRAAAPLKRLVERNLRRTPMLHRAASRFYYAVLDRSSEPVSPGMPDALECAFGLAREHGIGDRGDFYEFGLFRGGSFARAQRAAADAGYAEMHFWGFDSFAGLPAVEGVDAEGNRFFEGQFACSRAEVERRLDELGVDWGRTSLIEGYFDRSLTPELRAAHPFRPVTIAVLDCDLYSSTRDVLAWLDDLLVDGSILLMDDWKSFGGGSDTGQPRALREYLEARESVHVEPLFDFPQHGRAFRIARAGTEGKCTKPTLPR
jgi:O-methyltransferase